MIEGFLRVKNWGRFQHYANRRPPWIKLYNDLMDDDDRFEALSELEQWQLVRVWLMASKSSRFTLDPDMREVPVIAANERTVRKAIKTLTKVPLGMFVTEGWLIPVTLQNLTATDSDASAAASAGASTALAPSIETREEEKYREEAKNASSLPDAVLEELATTLVVVDGPPKLTKSAAGRDTAFDALTEVCGIDPRSQRVTDVAVALQGRRGKAGIRRMFWEEQGGVKGDAFERLLAAEIRLRAVMYRLKLPGAALTPTALAKWWFDVLTHPEPQNGVVTVEERLWRNADDLETNGRRRSLEAG